MPEGDTIFRAARTLNRALAGSVVTRFETQLPQLARVDEDHSVAGRTVEFARATGKWLQIGFSGDLLLLSHMLMSGSWHIYRPDEAWQKSRFHMRVVITTSSIVAVAFNVQIAEFHTTASLARRPGFSTLGPDLLAVDFNSTGILSALAKHSSLEIGVALLKQSIAAGAGNVFKSEICFLARVNPFRHVGDLTRLELDLIVFTARQLLVANAGPTHSSHVITHSAMRQTTGRTDPSERLWVYHRGGHPCRICGTPILSRKQGADVRTTFWCPGCQPL